MSTLPKGWVQVPLGKFAAKTKNVDPSKSIAEMFELYSVPSFSMGSPQLSPCSEIKSSKQAVQPDDVLLCKIVPHINRVWTVKTKGQHRQIASGEWIVYRNHGCEPNYLRYCLSEESFREQFLSTLAGVGGSLMRARPSEVAKIEVPIPPLLEQRKIVAKLDSLTGPTARARGELERIPKLIQKYRESLMTSALSGAWVGEGAKGGWTDCKAKELFTWSSGKFLPKSKQTNGRIPVYGGNGINGTHDRALVDLPTIVVGRVGAQCGNVYLTGGPAWITDNAIFAQTISERVDPRFALLVLRHSDLNAQSGGTGQPYVNQDNLNDVEFCLPSLQEQQSILQRIEAAFAWLDRVAAEHANASRLLPKLDQAILAKAFRGELVPQDQNDEQVTFAAAFATEGQGRRVNSKRRRAATSN